MGQHGVGTALVAARHGAHAGGQFLQLEGLDQVVVGAGIQAGDTVGGGIAGGQHDHRGGVAAAAQRAQHAQAGARLGRLARFVRQAQVQQQQVEVFGRQRGMGGRHVVDPVHRMALQAQGLTQAVADHAVVFGEQQAHRVGRCQGRACER